MDAVREKWSSRAAFIVTSIGAAIGFGNVWRFPNLAFDYGGGAFFIPYLLALFIIGIPLLMLEISVGQFYQTGDAGAFGRINKRFRGIGLSSVFCSFVVTLYYCQLLVWDVRLFIFSFQGSQAGYRNDNATEALAWFAGTVTGASTARENGLPTRLVGPNVGILALIWLIIFLCLAFGVKWTGRIAFFTVGLPVVFLFVLLVRAVTLEGAGDGVNAYIREWDVRVLRNRPAVWSEAVTQIFFSLSITFGVMTAFASYNPRNSPVFTNSIIIAISNSVYSIVAGFAVFGTAGYLANETGTTVEKLDNLAGPALVFVTYPQALSKMSGSEHWERLLFVVLFLLGIDSAFALTEAVITVIKDSALFRRVHRSITVAVVCGVSFLIGLLYTTDSGLSFLDVTDFYVNFMMLLVGLFETFSVGWIYGVDQQIETLGRMPVVAFIIAIFAPVTLASGLWFGLKSRATMWGFIALVVAHVVLMIFVIVLLWLAKRSRSELTWRKALMELYMGNMLKLRANLIGVVRYIPLLWFVLIRFFIPPILLILFANLASSKVQEEGAHQGRPKFGNYFNLATGFQALGITVFSISLLLLVIGVAFPGVYACFDIGHVEKDVDEEGLDKPTEEEKAKGNVV